MFEQAKWFGLSLVLHLAVAITLILSASKNVERTPKIIMVVLDNFAALDIQPHNVSQAPAAPTARSSAPARLPETAKPEVMRQRFHPAVPSVLPITSAAEQKGNGELLKGAPEVPVAAASRQRIEDSNTALKPMVKVPVQNSEPAAEEGPTSEKVQQRYIKEHFTYIRDLITTHLTYPPLARKMNWSGKVVVAFVIAGDGTVNNIRVVETSGFKILDKSAMETVRRVAPFPKPPQRAEIVVPINFRMNQ